jgi:Na+/H+ antiporter NhaD/arsenite permease-like protein
MLKWYMNFIILGDCLMIDRIINTVRQEAVFFIAATATLSTCFFRLPDIGSIDWKVIAALFNLMLVSLALEEYKLLDKIAAKALISFGSTKKITAAMIVTTALIAMLVTNDVALITVVPLTIVMAKKAHFDPYEMIILETAAANIGSSLTPFGNPQNLYLYEFYKIPTLEFLTITSLFVVAGMSLLFVVNLFHHNKKLHFEEETIQITDKRRIAVYVVVLILILLSIIRLVDYRMVTLTTVILFTLLDRKLIIKLDYFLLGTFVMFFLFVNNVTHMEYIINATASLLTSPIKVLITSAVLSQGISNVPAAILLSAFTQYHKPLLLGVSIGGMGTMVASLANLISYKLYCKEYSRQRYNKLFYLLNFILLLLLLAVGVAIIKIMY